MPFISVHLWYLLAILPAHRNRHLTSFRDCKGQARPLSRFSDPLRPFSIYNFFSANPSVQLHIIYSTESRHFTSPFLPRHRHRPLDTTRPVQSIASHVREQLRLWQCRAQLQPRGHTAARNAAGPAGHVQPPAAIRRHGASRGVSGSEPAHDGRRKLGKLHDAVARHDAVAGHAGHAAKQSECVSLPPSPVASSRATGQTVIGCTNTNPRCKQWPTSSNSPARHTAKSSPRASGLRASFRITT